MGVVWVWWLSRPNLTHELEVLHSNVREDLLNGERAGRAKHVRGLFCYT